MTAELVGAVVDALPPVAARQLARLLEVAVRDASYDVQPAVRAFVRDLQRLSAARRVAVALADTPARPQMSATARGGADGRPFGDELTTGQAADRLGVCPRQVRRRCRFPSEHPDRLRSRLSRGALVVSGFDVDAPLRR